MRTAPLALLLVWAAPAGADTATSVPTHAPTWAESCAERIDEAARSVGLPAGAHGDKLPTVREDGSPNPATSVEYAAADGLFVSTGSEPGRHADKGWTRTLQSGGKPARFWFRRAHGRYAKINISLPVTEKPFQKALDDCLTMGESK